MDQNNQEYHAVIFPSEIGIQTIDYLRPDEFICPGCNYVAHNIRKTNDGRCDYCNEVGA